MYHETAIQPLCDIKTVTVLMAMRNLKEILLLLLSSIVLVRLTPTREGRVNHLSNLVIPDVIYPS